MERNRNGRPNDRKVGWLPEMDRLLLVGMKHGPKGIREVKKRLKHLAPGLTPGEIWKRMRHLRENSSDGHRDPRQWPPEIIQLLKDGYQYGGSRKKEALKIFREQYPGCRAMSYRDLLASRAGRKSLRGHQLGRRDDHGPNMKRNYCTD